MMPRSLKGQLILLMLVGLILSQAASFLFILADQRSRLRNEWLHNLFTRIAAVSDVIESTPSEFHANILKSSSSFALKFSIEDVPLSHSREVDPNNGIEQGFDKVFGDRANEINITMLDSQGEDTYFTLMFSEVWRDIHNALEFQSPSNAKPPARPPFAHVSVPLKSGQWLNAVLTPRQLAPHVTPLLVQFATMAAISAVGIILALSRLTHPLKELAKAAAALGRGESTANLDEKGPLEVIATIRAFNDMQERLSRFVLDRTKMLAALGHDLRTPITSLRLRAEFIEDDEIRQKILETLDEIFEMAEATLSFAREEAAQERTRLVDVGALISTVCADLADTGFPVECAETGSFTIRCRPIGLKRAFRNVIENAVAYGRRARVSIAHRPGEVAVMIDDDGPGIPDGDMERVFSPFVRLETSRNMDTGGVGLGLAIVRSIVRGHGGDIALQNRPGGGLRVTIALHGVAVIETPDESTEESAAA
ncbi:MAG: ATP-binding protein [Rhodomicrobium sp.]